MSEHEEGIQEIKDAIDYGFANMPFEKAYQNEWFLIGMAESLECLDVITHEDVIWLCRVIGYQSIIKSNTQKKNNKLTEYLDVQIKLQKEEIKRMEEENRQMEERNMELKKRYAKEARISSITLYIAIVATAINVIVAIVRTIGTVALYMG